MLGTTVGIVERSKGESWDDILKAGLAVGILYMIIAFLTTLVGIPGVITLTDGLASGIGIGLIFALFLGLFVGIMETLFGGIFYEVVQVFQKELR